MSVLSLGYLHLRTPNLDAWQSFATDVLGLMPTAGPVDGCQYYRWDHYPHRLVLEPGDVVYVLRSPLQRWNDTITRLLPSVQALNAAQNLSE